MPSPHGFLLQGNPPSDIRRAISPLSAFGRAPCPEQHNFPVSEFHQSQVQDDIAVGRFGCFESLELRHRVRLDSTTEGPKSPGKPLHRWHHFPGSDLPVKVASPDNAKGPRVSLKTFMLSTQWSVSKPTRTKQQRGSICRTTPRAFCNDAQGP